MYIYIKHPPANQVHLPAIRISTNCFNWIIVITLLEDTSKDVKLSTKITPSAVWVICVYIKHCVCELIILIIYLIHLTYKRSEISLTYRLHTVCWIHFQVINISIHHLIRQPSSVFVCAFSIPILSSHNRQVSRTSSTHQSSFNFFVN